MHQVVEYVLGLALATAGLQSPTPAVPAVVASVIIINAAITKAPLAAFRIVGRRLHRVVDIGVIGFEFLAAVQPAFSVESSTRMIIGAIAFVHAFVWWQSSYMEKLKKTAAAVDPATLKGDRSHQIGRTAGRLVGSGMKVARNVKDRRARR